MSEKRVLLLVEDDPLVGMATQGLLEDLGYDVLGPAADATEALAMATSERPDLVVTDINLRRHGDGVELAAELHRRLGLSSLFLSGDAPQAPILSAAYAAGYLQKPYNRTKLGDAVQAALSRIGAA